MGGGTPDIGFIGHGAERSGPPISLLLLQQWLAEHTDLRFSSTFGAGGDLLDEFAAIAPVQVVDDRWTPARVAQQGLARVGLHGPSRRLRSARDRLALRAVDGARLLYVNTLSPETVRLADAARPAGPIVLHVHEMEAALRHRIPPTHLASLLARAEHLVAASVAVERNLVEHRGVAPERIVVHHEHIRPTAPIGRDERTVRRVASGLHPGSVVVVGSGRLEWRKAPDLFIQVAHRVRRLRPDAPIEFVWVGGDVEGPEHWPIDHDVRALRLEEHVHFVGEHPDPAHWWQQADLFALTSREDAYPLACLEAASAEVPIVTFDTGGMVELVEDDAGVVVPYPEVDGFAEALVALTEDDERRRSLGRRAREKVLAHAVDRSVPGFVDQLRTWLDQ